MANSYLQRSSANSSASGTTATVSMWVRKHDESAGDGGFFQFWNSGSNFCSGYANPTLKMRNFIAGGYSQGDITCNRKLRDNGAWYHCQFVWDTTNSTAGDRMRLYINGVRETSFSSSTNPSSGYSFYPLEAGTFYLNRYNANTTTGSQSYSHVHYCDGYAYEPTVFGEFDTNGTGEWKIKTSPTCNYGSNGFFILKDGNSTTDQSGNSKTFSTTGTLTNTEDNPSNVFATINGLFQPDPSNGTFSTTNGGLSFTTNFTSQSIMGVTTIGATSGKYYAEFKLTGESGSGEAFAGIGYDIYDQATSSINADSSFMWNVCSNGTSKQGGSEQPSGNWSNLYTTNDIISIAMDLDNNRVYFAKNGQYADGSGNWDEAFTGSPAYATITADKTYFFCAGDKSTSTNASWTCNFGNGYFGTTAISSEGTNASGIGKFEYDVPAGYTALSTKGLNE